MDGVPHLLHFLDRHFKAHQKPAVQILPHGPPQRVHARKIARRLDEVREVDDLFQHRHVRLSGRVPKDCIVNFIVHAEHVPRERRAGLGVEQLERLFLQRVERDAVLLAQRELLRHRELLCAVVQQSRDLRTVNVRAVFLRQLHRRRRRAEHMGAALRLEIAQRDGAELLYR